ncbi:MAG: MSMEG_0568 family radical SAM protein [Desulfobacterota bacterium]|jgi:radical SAM protein (TIGR04043 family)/putative N-acetyltransferase (TIGR04045 family)|nr:MSMEG_0568 family radical SAM protein [Thermodesulfobacteriota bacterium]
MSELKHLVTELQSFGLRLENQIMRRKGGAGPAEGGALLIGGRPVSVPVASPFVSASPFRLEKMETGFWISRDGRPELPVEIMEPPRFYRGQTREGLPYSHLALLHGRDCLATTIHQRCVHWEQGRSCWFCGIEISLKNQSTLAIKTPEQLAEVTSAATDLDGIRHVVLTTGTCGTPEKDIDQLARCAAAIKKASGLPVHVQCLPPPQTGVLEILKKAEVDTIGLHIESFDESVLAETAPAKAAIGLQGYLRAWQEAVELFGPNQVSSFLIAGLGEKKESILQGTALLADLGVYPFIVPLRPIPGTFMENARPPDPDFMVEVYETVAEMLKNKGLAAVKNLAGCVRCGACSALPFYEQPLETLVCHPARTREEKEWAAAIRHRVFVEEQKLFPETDRDENDRKSIHLVAVNEGNIVGTVRVFPEENNGHWIGGRLAIQKDFRFSGAGEALVREAVATVRRKGCNLFTAHIQRENVPFFVRLGWQAVGPMFEYRGRPHQLMEADLKQGLLRSDGHR